VLKNILDIFANGIYNVGELYLKYPNINKLPFNKIESNIYKNKYKIKNNKNYFNILNTKTKTKAKINKTNIYNIDLKTICNNWKHSNDGDEYIFIGACRNNNEKLQNIK